MCVRLRLLWAYIGHKTLGLATVCILGGSWVVINGVISPLIWVITIVTLLIAPLVTTHEPPSMFRTAYIYRRIAACFRHTPKL